MNKLSGSSAIYLQIQEYFKAEIASGRLRPNSQIEPIRSLAISFGVNPNTISKALVGLEDLGLIYTERTLGKYVIDDQGVIDSLKLDLSKNLVEDFIVASKNIGLNFDEVNDLIKERWNDLGE